MPVPLGQPVCAMKPSMTRWNGDAVVEALARQLLDALDVLGGEVGAQLDDDAALGRLDDERVLRIVQAIGVSVFLGVGVRSWRQARLRLPHMPAHAGRVDDVDLAAPWKIGGLLETHAGKSLIEPLAGDVAPVRVEIVDLECQHLVLLPLRHVDVLQHERRTAEAQAGKSAVAPTGGKAELGEEGERLREVGARRHERDERGGLNHR